MFSCVVAGNFTPVVRMEIILLGVEFVLVVVDNDSFKDVPVDVLNDENRIVDVSKTENNGISLVEVKMVCLALVADLDCDTDVDATGIDDDNVRVSRKVTSVVLGVFVVNDVIHLAKFLTLPVVFSIYLRNSQK